MPTLSILSCTDRPDANAHRIAESLEPLYRDFGADVHRHSLCEFPHADVVGGTYGSTLPSVEAYNREVMDADSYLWIVPEYNGGFPGILKLFFDYLPFPEALNRKPIALIGEADGRFGAMRPVEQLQDLLIYRKAMIYPERVFLPSIGDRLDQEEAWIDDASKARLQHQAEGFTDWVERLVS
ncbi:MAG: NAD(P)H-dependent oxidoreductase [Balneolaceae bacterium]